MRKTNQEGEGAVRCSVGSTERAFSEEHTSHTAQRVQMQLWDRIVACFNFVPHLYDSK